jgi:transposase
VNGGLTSDKEWGFSEPILTCSTKRPANTHRRVRDDVFRVARTGAGWRDLPADFGKWNSEWKRLRRWIRFIHRAQRKTVSDALRPLPD